ncbi:hypothetical protein K438DRAFT_1778078 [Mycena galopus ATCC 62051]|nr:hypothetical protein K438DRAFT_1778078 [Mycena galopus ATCC 62051]
MFWRCLLCATQLVGHCLVKIAVAQVKAESEEFVQGEMETVVKQAIKTTAYTGLGQLKMMDLEQRRTFSVHTSQLVLQKGRSSSNIELVLLSFGAPGSASFLGLTYECIILI